MDTKTWFLIESDTEYDLAFSRYNEIKYAKKGTIEHKEKKLLVFLIGEYEEKVFEHPEINPIELILTRMDDLGLKASDLANVYGDKGTISKVLNYKQALSITMIRKFSELLQVSANDLLPEYELITPKKTNQSQIGTIYKVMSGYSKGKRAPLRAK